MGLYVILGSDADSVHLGTEAWLSTVLGLDLVDVGIELGVMGDLLPLDQGVGKGEGLLELGRWEGGEEGWVLGVGELALVEAVGWVGHSLENILYQDTMSKSVTCSSSACMFGW